MHPKTDTREDTPEPPRNDVPIREKKGALRIIDAMIEAMFLTPPLPGYVRYPAAAFICLIALKAAFSPEEREWYEGLLVVLGLVVAGYLAHEVGAVFVAICLMMLVIVGAKAFLSFLFSVNGIIAIFGVVVVAIAVHRIRKHIRNRKPTGLDDA